MGTTRWFFRITQGLAILALLLALGCHFALDSVYVGYPKLPDAATARIAPYELGGHTVYVTQPQRVFLHWLVVIQVGALGSLVGAHILERLNLRMRRDPGTH